MTRDAILKANYSSRSGSGALEGARGAERRESDTRAGVRVRYARLGARRGCAVGGGAWAWVGCGGAEDDRVRLGAACSCEHVRTEFKLQNEGQMSLVQSVAVSGR